MIQWRISTNIIFKSLVGHFSMLSNSHFLSSSIHLLSNSLSHTILKEQIAALNQLTQEAQKCFYLTYSPASETCQEQLWLDKGSAPFPLYSLFVSWAGSVEVL